MTEPTALVIDPDAPSRELHALLLRTLGYEVFTAANRREGRHLARTERPTLIVTELFVDSSDTFPLIDALKHDPATRNIPIVVLTASGLPKEVSGALIAGAAAILPKPCKVTNLKEAIARL